MSKKKFIYADDLAELIKNLDITVAGESAKWSDAKASVLKIIDEMPAADVVEVNPCRAERYKEYQKRYRKERGEYCKNNKICYACFKRDSYTEAGRMYCVECTKKHNEYLKEYMRRKRGLSKK